MKLVNFLPEERLQGSPIRQIVPPLIIGTVLALAAVFVPWQLLSTQQGELAERITVSEELIGILPDQEAAAKNAEFARLNADLISRVQAVNTIVAAEVQYPEIFALVQNSLPADITLSSLSIALPLGKPTVRFSAEAPSNASYAAFLELLRSDTRFESIVTDGYNYNASRGSVSFSITLVIKQSGVKK